MAHNLLGQRFYNRSSKPAWHRLGLNAGDTDYRTAREAVEAIGGIYHVEKREITFPLSGVATPTGYSFIVRSPIAEDPHERIFGTPVPNDYEIITPDQAVTIYDESVKDASGRTAPVETAGVLGKGERLFITTRLPFTMSIRGDEVVSYLLFDNPMAHGNAAAAYVTPVRTVCQNTLIAGVAEASEKRKIPHHKGAARVMAEWLAGIYERALAASGILQDAYNKLAQTRINEDQVQWVVDALYPDPKQPSFKDTATRSMEDREKWYEYGLGYAQQQRKLVKDLYNGKGVGMDTDAVKGTAFGLYNAAAEFESYRRSRGGEDKSTESLIAGERARRIRTAFALCEVVDRYETVNASVVARKVFA